jgi:hypothetical protein
MDSYVKLGQRGKTTPMVLFRRNLSLQQTEEPPEP